MVDDARSGDERSRPGGLHPLGGGPAADPPHDEHHYDHADDETLTSALPPRIERWRKRSATGAMMTGFAFGLREVFEPERKDPSIMLETSGVPPTDLAVEAEFDGIGAKRSVVRIRPWLLQRTGGTEAPDDGGGVQRIEAVNPDGAAGGGPISGGGGAEPSDHADGSPGGGPDHGPAPAGR